MKSPILLPLVDQFRSLGKSATIQLVVLHQLLAVSVIYYLYVKVGGLEASLERLAGCSHYFILSMAFGVCMTSLEREYFSGIFPQVKQRFIRILMTRLVWTFTHLFAVICFFSGTFLFLGLSSWNFLTLVIEFVAAVLLATFLGLRYGERSEKALNNMNYIMTWTLSLSLPFLM